MKEAFEKDVGQALKKLSDARSVMQKALEAGSKDLGCAL